MNANWFLQLVTLELFQTTNLSEGLPAPLVYEKERLIEAMLILLKFIQLRVVVFFETPTRSKIFIESENSWVAEIKTTLKKF